MPKAARQPTSARPADLAVLSSLRPASAVLAVSYALVAAVDYFALSSVGPAALAAVSALLFAGLRFWLDHGRGVATHQSHEWGTGLAALLLLNGVIHILVIPSPWQVTHVVVSLVGAGCLFVSTRWLAAVISLSIGMWAAASWFALPRGEWIAAALLAWGASVVGLAAHRVRVNARREIKAAERRRQDREHSTFELLGTAIAVVDRYGNMVGSSPAWRESQDLHLFGASRNGARLNYLASLDEPASNHVGEASDIAAGVRKVLSGQENEFSYEYWHPATAERRSFGLRAGRLKGAEKERILVAVTDITARKESERLAREFEQRYSLAFRTASDGLWDWDLKKKEIYFSPRWNTILGFREGEIGKDPEDWLSQIHGSDARALLAKLSDHLDGKTDEFEGEHRMKHPDGGYRWILTRGIAIRDALGKPIRIVGSQVDITARKRAEGLNQNDSLYDTLTGLPNRSSLRQNLKRAAEETGSKTNVLYALLYLDIDRFQLVNDGLGHTIGDHLLIGIADRLKKCLRPGDSIARLGGDEFAILLENLNDVSQATEIASRIQVEVARPFKVGGQEVFTAVSIGIAMGSYGRETSGNLLRNADTALNQAKSQGRARFALFNNHMHADALDLLSLETALQRSLERKEFKAHYQPIVALESGRIVGCEALLRWSHPDKGLVPPSEFIPVAEEAGLIKDISNWIIREACGQAVKWQQSGLPPVRVAVNISPGLLKMEGFAAFITKILQETRLPPELLQLELTESVLMESDSATIQPLVELSSKGVEISLNDFGTGYSSLSHLQRFPINSLKIDKSFMRHVAINPGNAAIASGLIALAHNLDLRIVAEGVETNDQLDFCVAKKCEEVQGILISPPVEADVFAALLEESQSKQVLALAQETSG